MNLSEITSGASNKAVNVSEVRSIVVVSEGYSILAFITGMAHAKDQRKSEWPGKGWEELTVPIVRLEPVYNYSMVAEGISS